MALPVGLQPRLREVPALAWTVTRAFTAVPPANQTRPGPMRLLSALWSVPAFMFLYLPILLFSVWSGYVVRLDRRALLLVLPAGRALERVKLTVPFAWLLATAGPVGLFAPGPMMVALGVPLVTDLAGVLVAACRAGPGSAGHAKQLAGQGHPVATVGLYAANPRGQGHGSALLDVLLEQAPAGLWLLATAREDALARLYISRYGFRVWDPSRPLLLERPPATVAPAARA